jgi:hypothetical protein
MSIPRRTNLGVKCEKCGTFAVLIVAEEGSQVTDAGGLAGPCPQCGNNVSARPDELERADAVGGS